MRSSKTARGGVSEAESTHLSFQLAVVMGCECAVEQHGKPVRMKVIEVVLTQQRSFLLKDKMLCALGPYV